MPGSCQPVIADTHRTLVAGRVDRGLPPFPGAIVLLSICSFLDLPTKIALSGLMP
jgi:hypothetical protein